MLRKIFILFFSILLLLSLCSCAAHVDRPETDPEEFYLFLRESDPDEIVDYLNHYWGIERHYYSSDEVRDLFSYAFCTGYQDSLKGVSDPLVREYSDIADYEYYDSKYGDMFP